MKTRPAPALVDDVRILATPERLRHDFVEYGEREWFYELGSGRRGTERTIGHRVKTQRTIDRLVLTGIISPPQFQAAEKLWRLIHSARMVGLARVNPIGDRVSGGGGVAIAEHVVDAREQAKQAIAAVPARLRAVLRWVVVDDLALRYCAARRAGRAIGGREVAAVAAELGEGLDALVRFWRL